MSLSLDQVRVPLAAVPLFSALDSHCLDELGRTATLRTLPAGQRLMFQGEMGSEFYVILSGSIRLTLRPDGDGDPFTLAVLGPGEYLGEMALLEEGPRSATAEALQASELLVLQRARFVSLVRSNPDLALGLLQGMARRLRQTSEDAAAVAHLDAYQRVVRKIVGQAEKQGAHSGAVSLDIPLSVDVLAGMTGCESGGVSLLLQLMEFDGLLRRKGDHLSIPDLERLRRSRGPRAT